MKKLISHQISESWQVEIMRNIYNDNLDMLSTSPIPYRSFEEQKTWWDLNKRKLKAYLYEDIARKNDFVAFSVLTNRGGFFTPIIAIKKEAWGKGFGSEIILDYLQKANGPLAGSQLKSNEAICHMNRKVGWEIVDEVLIENKMVQLLYHPGLNSETAQNEELKLKILEYLDEKYKSNK